MRKRTKHENTRSSPFSYDVKMAADGYLRCAKHLNTYCRESALFNRVVGLYSACGAQKIMKLYLLTKRCKIQEPEVISRICVFTALTLQLLLYIIIIIIIIIIIKMLTHLCTCITWNHVKILSPVMSICLIVTGNPGVLYQSVHKSILSLPEDFLLYPAHDYKGMTVFELFFFLFFFFLFSFVFLFFVCCFFLFSFFVFSILFFVFFCFLFCFLYFFSFLFSFSLLSLFLPFFLFSFVICFFLFFELVNHKYTNYYHHLHWVIC